MPEINLIAVKCPLNFVKAKLALEKLEKGQILKIILALGEASETVPKSLIAEGYEIIESDLAESHLEIKVKV